uniref:NADH dehydrogenase [ubiquinone] iron-sulfur protein 5 n=1 Tax=Otus sunia TaxID=257818 RepID=A0A8C8BNH8_9STRI
ARDWGNWGALGGPCSVRARCAGSNGTLRGHWGGGTGSTGRTLGSPAGGAGARRPLPRAARGRRTGQGRSCRPARCRSAVKRKVGVAPAVALDGRQRREGPVKDGGGSVRRGRPRGGLSVWGQCPRGGERRAMPFWDLQRQLGIDVDRFMLRQSMPQPYGKAAACHAFEREWVECGHGLGQTRARRECQPEYEDFMECMHRTKLAARLKTILEQREKLIKEGKYTPPDYHKGKEESRP